MKKLAKIIIVMLCALSFTQWAEAKVTVRDAEGHNVSLLKPANRLVVLAPHAVEFLYEIGAGSDILATVEYADYPAAAKKLPRVGNAFALSLDAIVRYKPDLVVVWGSQSKGKEVEKLRELGYPIYVSNPVQLDEVANEMEALGVLTGHVQSAQTAAKRYRSDLAKLQQQYAGLKPIKVFVQLNENPLFTVSDKSFMGQAINLCGGRNIFGSLPAQAPQVSIEAVVRGAPEAIFSTFGLEQLNIWLKWPVIPAVSNKAMYALPDDVLSRPGPRLTEGIANFCRMLDGVRRQSR